LVFGNYSYQAFAQDAAGNIASELKRNIVVEFIPTVELFYPYNDSLTTDRVPIFYWNGTDDQGRALVYQFNLTLLNESTPTEVCADPRVAVNTGEAENYTLESYLKCFYGDGYFYLWTARASADGGINWGPWAEPWLLKLDSYVSINLLVDSIDFGVIAYNGTNSTEDDNPGPFVLENDGNTLVNVSINATDLWLTQPNPSDYYRFKISEYLLERGAFNFSASLTYWTNVFASSNPVESIIDFNWTSQNNTAEIDINITVPGVNEGAGSRSSIMTFTAEMSE